MSFLEAEQQAARVDEPMVTLTPTVDAPAPVAAAATTESAADIWASLQLQSIGQPVAA